MLKKLFGGQKSSYFLELDESKSQQPTTTKTEAPAEPVEEKKAEPAETTAVEESKAKPAETKKTTKTSVKNKSKAKAAQPAPAPKAPEPKVSDPEAIIRAAVSKKDSNGKADAQAVGFATQYVMLPTMSRRRPGPSLNMFLNMARQAKVPRKG
jgi:hypothetical protein